MLDTKDRILDAAERLFGEQGYAAVSLRHIIAEADVNLAAIHYHFGSKEELLDQLVGRVVGPVNRARLDMLERFEADACGGPIPVEQILEAFLVPTGQLLSRVSVKLMGRLYGEGLMPALVERHFKPAGKRFVNALRRTLPHIPDEEFFWRVEFMIGAMAHSMMQTQILHPVAGAGDGPADMSPGSRAARRIASLISFSAAGLSAPATTKELQLEVSR